MMAVQKWKPIIGGSKVIIYTDNKNLINNFHDFSKKVNRWKAYLGYLNIEYEHVKGSENNAADFLSRNTNNAHEVNKFNNIHTGRVVLGPPTFHYRIKLSIYIRSPMICRILSHIKTINKIDKSKHILLKNQIKTCINCQINKKKILFTGNPKVTFYEQTS
ncbi:Enzymatic polyprotein [Dictyocoela muelleri]|nr:Enzymatic polyprotein [Dictyocoela muelleri]